MSISSIDPLSVPMAAYASQTQGTSNQPEDQVLSSVAQLLGVSTSQLQSDLSSGKSLQSIASAALAQNVSGSARHCA